jgi:TetR/AcrR family transcriptional regulator, repressor of fatR-cypB operon
MKPKDENKINDIYTATLTLVKQNGLAGITMQSVAKEAGIATGTLYIYFKNKEALIISLFNECVKNNAGNYFKKYDPEQSFETGFHIIWNNILQIRLSRFNESIFIEQSFHSPYIDETTKINVRKLVDPLVQLLERGKKEKLVKDIDSFWLISFMMGTINEAAKRIIYHNKKMTPDMLDINFRLCWDGMKA